MEKLVSFDPAYDKRDPDPNKNYGVHGVTIRFIIKGELGAVQFVIYTNWQLPHVTEFMLGERQYSDCHRIRALFQPMPADLGYHSPTPTYDGQEILTDTCEYLDGKPCYYDGSSLNAERIFRVLLEGGDTAVWKELDDYYVNCFGELK